MNDPYVIGSMLALLGTIAAAIIGGIFLLIRKAPESGDLARLTAAVEGLRDDFREYVMDSQKQYHEMNLNLVRLLERQSRTKEPIT